MSLIHAHRYVVAVDQQGGDQTLDLRNHNAPQELTRKIETIIRIIDANVDYACLPLVAHRGV